MNKALLITLGALLRRFGTMAGTALLTVVAVHYQEWLRNAMENDPKTAAWIPLVWLLIEFIQKLIRERNKEKMEDKY